MITRHISIDEEYIDMINIYMDRHNGNLGAALEEIIYNVEYGSNTTLIDSSLLDWMVKHVENRLVPEDVIDKIIDPSLINEIEVLQEYLNKIFENWNILINIQSNWINHDNRILNLNDENRILVELRGQSQKIKLIASILSRYFIKNSEHNPLGIKKVVSFGEYIRIEIVEMSKKEAVESLVTFFGNMEESLEAIETDPPFWNSLIKEHVSTGYNMVTIHRNCFEDILSDNMPIGEIMIENIAKKPARDIPLKELLAMIKNIYQTSKIIDKIEIDQDDIILYHSYRNQNAIEKLKNMFVSILENNGHLYEAKLTSTMIILRHKINDNGKLLINELLK